MIAYKCVIIYILVGQVDIIACKCVIIDNLVGQIDNDNLNNKERDPV